jgi:type IV pilus assembly protein PilA
MQSTLLRPLRRPFSNAHWFLLLSLVFAWELLLWFQPCKESPHYFEVTGATITVCIALWLNHLREAPANSWRSIASIVMGATYDLITFALLALLVALPIVLVMPEYDCYTPRTKVSELILSASNNRVEITNRLAVQKTLRNVGVGLQLDIGNRAKGGLITNDGTIIIASEDPPAVVILSPTLSEGTVTWKCMGFPLKYMPISCRQ